MIEFITLCILSLGTVGVVSSLESANNDTQRLLSSDASEYSPNSADVYFRDQERRSWSQSRTTRSHRDVIDIHADGTSHGDSDGLGGGFEGD